MGFGRTIASETVKRGSALVNRSRAGNNQALFDAAQALPKSAGYSGNKLLMVYARSGNPFGASKVYWPVVSDSMGMCRPKFGFACRPGSACEAPIIGTSVKLCAEPSRDPTYGQPFIVMEWRSRHKRRWAVWKLRPCCRSEWVTEPPVHRYQACKLFVTEHDSRFWCNGIPAPVTRVSPHLINCERRRST